MSQLPTSFSIAMTAHAWENDAPIKDAFTIYGNGCELFKVTFLYQIDGREGNESATVERLGEFNASDLPGIYSSFHLIGKLQGWLADMLNERDVEFYNDVFLDEEDERVTYSINALFSEN